MISIWVFQITYYLIIYSWNVVWLLASWYVSTGRDDAPSRKKNGGVLRELGTTWDNHQFTLGFPNSKDTIHMDDNFR